MNLTVSEEVAQWYKDELDIEDGTHIRFYVRYGGVGGIVPGFSLGVNTDSPQLIYTSTHVNNIEFYIEQSDAWYFENKDLTVTLDNKTLEPKFSYS